jgi:hypothetical protein
LHVLLACCCGSSIQLQQAALLLDQCMHATVVSSLQASDRARPTGAQQLARLADLLNMCTQLTAFQRAAGRFSGVFCSTEDC